MTEPRTELRYFDQKLGRVVLKHPRDCGRAECKICHPHKYAGNSLKYKTARNVRERTQTRMMTIDLRETSLAA